MEILLRPNQMEEIEGLSSQYPYAFHHVDLEKTLIPWHWHEALEFNYLVEGSLKISTTSGSQELHQGQGFFINTNVLSTLNGVGRCVLDSHLFHPIFLTGHFNSIFETKYLQPVTQNRNLELVVFTGASPLHRQLLDKLRSLAQVQQQPDSEFLTRNLLSEIWLLLLEEVRTLDTASTGSSQRHKDRLLTMMTYIQEHFSAHLTLEDIAASAAISSRECLRCFRSAIDQSPMDYLTAYRIGQAKKLLESTSLPVTEIALRCGFNAPAYFSKVFRQQIGCTPLAHRKRHT